MRRSLANGSRAMASHASRARAGRSRQRQSKWADSTRRCTRNGAGNGAVFCLVTIPAAARSARAPMWLFPLGLPAAAPSSSRRPSTKRRSRTSRAWSSRRGFWIDLRSGFFGHGRESFLDGFKWNADKVGVPWLPPVSRPGSIIVSRACDIGDVVLGAGYPP